MASDGTGVGGATSGRAWRNGEAMGWRATLKMRSATTVRSGQVGRREEEGGSATRATRDRRHGAGEQVGDGMEERERGRWRGPGTREGEKRRGGDGGRGRLKARAGRQ